MKTGTIKNLRRSQLITPEIKEPPRTSYSLRSADNMAEKRAIARLAAEQIEDGDSILLMREPPPAVLSNLSKIRKKLTVVTNNLDFIIQALPYKIFGSSYLAESLSGILCPFLALDEIGAEMLKNYNFKKGFSLRPESPLNTAP